MNLNHWENNFMKCSTVYRYCKQALKYNIVDVYITSVIILEECFP